jgi:hypothetical protein
MENGAVSQQSIPKAHVEKVCTQGKRRRKESALTEI